MITILVIAGDADQARRWIHENGWGGRNQSVRVAYAGTRTAALGRQRASTFYVCTGTWLNSRGAVEAVDELERRDVRELDDTVSLLGALGRQVSADPPIAVP